MNMTSLLKKGMKNVKEKIKIEAASDGVIVEGKKCATAESFMEAVKKVAKKDKSSGKTYGRSLGQTINSYRDTILQSFKLNDESETFYKKFVQKFKNKIVVPVKLESFYNKYTEKIDPEIKQDYIDPVYLALSFYALRERGISGSSTKNIKLKPINDFLGYSFKGPKDMLKKTKSEYKKMLVECDKISQQILKTFNEAVDKVENKFPNTFNNYYGDGTNFSDKATELKQPLTGFYNGVNRLGTKENLPDSIDKEDLRKEYAVYDNLRRNPKEFEKRLRSEIVDDKIVETHSIVYNCITFLYFKNSICKLGKGYLLELQGNETEAKKLINDEASFKNIKEYKEMIDELKEVAACESEIDASEVAQNHGRKISRNAQRASFSAPKTPVEDEDKKAKRKHRKSI